MSVLRNLDEPCPLCDGKLVADHTMREWAAHMDSSEDVDLPYEETPEPFKMNLDGEDVIVADSIVARATLFTGDAGAVGVIVPCLLLDFQVGKPGGRPQPVSRVGVIGPPETMRKIGKLLRDTANGAANAAERQGSSWPT